MIRPVKGRFAALDLLNRNRSSIKRITKMRRPIPFGPLAAAVQIECRRAVFRICVAGEVRFRQCDKARDAAFAVELVPDRTDRAQAEIGDDPFEDRSNHTFIAKEFGFAAGRFDEPFSSNYHLIRPKLCT